MDIKIKRFAIYLFFILIFSYFMNNLGVDTEGRDRDKDIAENIILTDLSSRMEGLSEKPSGFWGRLSGFIKSTVALIIFPITYVWGMVQLVNTGYEGLPVFINLIIFVPFSIILLFDIIIPIYYKIAEIIANFL